MRPYQATVGGLAEQLVAIRGYRTVKSLISGVGLADVTPTVGLIRQLLPGTNANGPETAATYS